MSSNVHKQINQSTKFCAILFSALICCISLYEPSCASNTISEYDALKNIPPEIPAKLSHGGKPDTEGLVGHNRTREGGWVAVFFQRGALTYLLAGIVRGDQRQVDDAWRAIDVAFAHQQEDGGFDEGSKPHRGAGNDHGIPFFISQLSEALLVLRGSPMASNYEARIQELLPKIRKSTTWILEHESALYKSDRQAPNRLFSDANSLALSGLLLQNFELEKKGKEFLDKALSLQDPGGYFLESGGADSSYNAVNLLQLGKYAFYFPNAQLDEALKRSANWELTRILPSGEVDTGGNSRTGGQESFMGKAKGVNYEEVVLSLLLYGERFGAQDAIDSAQRAFGYHFK